jgi:hypothetical protein
MDKSVFRAYKMSEQGNSDFEYWFDKTHEEKLAAAASMIAVAFQEPEFLVMQLNRFVYSSRKQAINE